jgi:AcrR family transcriptional regulator
MVAAVAEHGYATTTVGEVVARARVSKRDFYREFESKEACFLAAFEGIVAEIGAEIERAFASKEVLEERVEATLETLARLAVERPVEMGLVVVDSLELGAASVSIRARAAALFESLIRSALAEQAGSNEVSTLKVRALVGGVRSILYRALRNGEPERLAEHVGELTRWGVEYRLAGERVAREGGPSVGERLVAAVEANGGPAAGNGEEPQLSWEEPANSPRSRAELDQRERIMRAAAQEAVARGYGALSIPTITAAAGVSNQTFYEHFGSAQEAFLAAFEALAQRQLLRVARALGEYDGWLEGGAAGIRALLDCFVEDPLFTALSFFEVSAAGTAALDKAEMLLVAFTLFLKPDPLPDGVPRQPSQVIVEAIAGGLWAAVEGEIVAGRVEALPSLAPELVDLVLVPFGVLR